MAHPGGPDIFLSRGLAANLRQVRSILGDSPDIVVREFDIGVHPPVRAALVFVDGLAGKPSVHEHIMKSLMLDASRTGTVEKQSPGLSMADIKESLLTMADVKEEPDLQKIIHGVLSGDTALLVDGFPVALVVVTRGWESRGISEPITEGAVRGPRDGFVETLRTNTALLRRRIKSPDLRFETMPVGRATRTDVTIAYIKDIVNEGVLAEVRRRLGRIDTDSVLESGYLEEFLRDHPYTPFPLIEYSERPDKIAAALLEGRVAILVDGTPFVLVVPAVFLQFFQASEDYYTLYHFGTLLRWGRFMGFLFTLYLPSLYIAVTTIHHELLPTSLALTIAGAREGVPYPALVEALLMELAFEALREAGIRLPRPVGQAVSIVGALIIGDAAVRAGLVSPAMVIVVAFTGIASFSVPSYKLIYSLRMLRFPMMTIAAVLGLPGIMMASVILLAHLVSLRSFGVPYLSPVAPFSRRDLKDILIRAPWWAMRTRPESIGSSNQVRQDPGQRPAVPGKDTPE
ncbi:hypothetical protein SY88_08800 [Clostridiales bacterium PH28_bin88]|nr:hypothetical protein SY88_08800 [Clostridiales bacterium PH28_bin88]